jgi:hypothetical protein
VSTANGTFLCFPLALLAMPEPEKDRLQVIISHAIERAGAGSDIEDARVDEYIRQKPGTGYAPHRKDHQTIIRGAIVLNVQVGHLPSTLGWCQEAKQFARALDAKHGLGPLVFISSELFWSCHNEDSPTFRDFSVLCGVNSIIGFRKTPVLIRRGMVIARQLGYKSPAVMAAELQNRKDQRPLTPQQLRDTLDRLESRELIHRCQASRRNVYFSTVTPWEELQKAVKEVVAHKRKVQLRRELDRAALSGTTTEPQENHLKRKEAKDGEKEPLKNGEPQRNHNGTTREPQPEPQPEPLKEVSEISAPKVLRNKQTEEPASKWLLGGRRTRATPA